MLCSFNALLPHFRVKVLLFVKHNSQESSTNKAWFRKFCKHLSIYLLFIYCVQEKRFCPSKCFGRNNMTFNTFIFQQHSKQDIPYVVVWVKNFVVIKNMLFQWKLCAMEGFVWIKVDILFTTSSWKFLKTMLWE